MIMYVFRLLLGEPKRTVESRDAGEFLTCLDQPNHHVGASINRPLS